MAEVQLTRAHRVESHSSRPQNPPAQAGGLSVRSEVLRHPAFGLLAAFQASF